GLVRSFQISAVFPHMTALENVRIALQRRRGDSFAWPLTIGLLILICVNVGFQYGINVWNRAIFDAIEQRNARII
ncbi:MAG: hypothetical protein E5V70_12555, partial [Mesorhizobium sp.]